MIDPHPTLVGAGSLKRGGLSIFRGCWQPHSPLQHRSYDENHNRRWVWYLLAGYLVRDRSSTHERMSENDRRLPISEGYDGVRLVEHVCLYFYAILVIADTPEMCSHGLPLHEQPRLPRSGGRHMRSYKGSVEPTHLAHPFRVVLILINHTNAIVYGNPGYNARTEEFQYPVYHVRKSHPATYHP
jgi:hypothetical protein